MKLADERLIKWMMDNPQESIKTYGEIDNEMRARKCIFFCNFLETFIIILKISLIYLSSGLLQI